MAGMRTTVKLDARLVDEAVKVLDAKSRTDAVHAALKEIVAMHRFNCPSRISRPAKAGLGR